MKQLISNEFDGILLTFSVNALRSMVPIVQFSNTIEFMASTSNAPFLITSTVVPLNLISFNDASNRCSSSIRQFSMSILPADLVNALSKMTRSRIYSKCP